MFSLRALLIATAVAALLIVAFLNYSAVWASIVVTLTFGILACALVAMYLLPERRAFLIPAVVVGSLYVYVATGGFNVPDAIVTNWLCYEVWYAHHGESAETAIKESGVRRPVDKASIYWLAMGPVKGGYYVWETGLPFFLFIQRIVTCGVALILGVIAGLVGSYVVRRRDLKARPNHV